MILLMLISLYYLYIHEYFMTITSDVASIALMADDFLNGNYLLSGWGLPSDSYYTVGALFAVLFMSIFGFSPIVVYLCAAVSSALAVFFTLMLIAQKRIANTTTYLIAAVLLLVPPKEMLDSFATPACHVATTAYLLAAVWLLGDLEWNKKKNSPFKIYFYLALYFSLLVLANFGDPFGYVITAALFAVLVYRAFFLKEKIAMQFAFTTILAVITINLLLKLMVILGGFTSHSLISAFTFGNLFHNIQLLLESGLSLFGMFYPRFLSAKSIPTSYYFLTLYRAPFFFIMLYAFILSIKNWWKSDDIVIQIACMTFFANAAAYVLNSYPTDLTSSRLLIPLVFMGAVLVGRQLVIKDKKWQIALLAFALGCAFTFSNKLIYKMGVKPPMQALITALNENHLRIGYGNYWAASAVTFRTNKAVIVRPVVFQSESGAFVATPWNTNKNWYVAEMRNETPNFFVLTPGDTLYGALTPKNEILKKFGKPAKTIDVSHYYEILVWDKKIDPLT